MEERERGQLIADGVCDGGEIAIFDGNFTPEIEQERHKEELVHVRARIECEMQNVDKDSEKI